MPYYLNLNVIVQYDFIITNLAFIFLFNWILAKLRITRLSNVFRPGNQVTIVTKPHLDCVKAICAEFPDYKDKILFRFTIGSSDSNTLKFWEPNAPDFAERLESLKYAFSEGYQTSVSCEPMLDDNIGDVIDQVSPFVSDSFWLGKANQLRSRLAFNGENDPITRRRADQLIEWQSDGISSSFMANLKTTPRLNGGRASRRFWG
jgi:DNA repair photolyase